MISAWWLLTLLPALWVGWKSGIAIGEVRQYYKTKEFCRKVYLLMQQGNTMLVEKLVKSVANDRP